MVNSQFLIKPNIDVNQFEINWSWAKKTLKCGYEWQNKYRLNMSGKQLTSKK